VSALLAADCQPALILLAGALISGCGGGPAKESVDFLLVPVTGYVTMDGQPFAGATLTFLYQGAAPAGYVGSGAVTDNAGKFTVLTGDQPGTIVGDYKVTVSKFTNPDGSAPQVDESAGMDLQQLILQGAVKEFVPPQYSNPDKTMLFASVRDTGAEALKFELHSR
jgi:hypothetical protein